jgi:hypothetical protein
MNNLIKIDTVFRTEDPMITLLPDLRNWYNSNSSADTHPALMVMDDDLFGFLKDLIFPREDAYAGDAPKIKIRFRGMVCISAPLKEGNMGIGYHEVGHE